MYLVKRSALVCIMAANASTGGLRHAPATTAEPGTDTTTLEPLQGEFGLPNPFSNRSGLALHRAAWSGDIRGVRSLLEQGANAQEADNKGVTILMAAVHSQNLDLIDLVVQRGVNVDQGDTIIGKTALIMAIDDISLDVMECLIRNGANVNQAQTNGQTALMAAARINMGPYMERSRRQMVDILIRAGVEIDQADNHGSTALIEAVRSRNLYMVQRLIEAGADVAHTMNNGRSALDDAEEEIRCYGNDPTLVAIIEALHQAPKHDSGYVLK